MKKIFQIIIIICGGLLLNSCYYDAFPEDDGDNGGGVEPPTEVSYKIQTDIVKYLTQQIIWLLTCYNWGVIFIENEKVICFFYGVA